MPPQKTKHSILIIEDEPSLLQALCDKFAREDFHVLRAEDGEMGLSLALQEEPDIILLDIIMPKMDGITMLKKLRLKNTWGKTVPVLILSNLGADDEKIMNDIKEDEFTSYLVKSNWAITAVVLKVKEKLPT